MKGPGGTRGPDVLVVGRVRARAVRGPRDDRRWYWRAERYASGKATVVWTGWGTIDEVEQEVARVVASRPAGDIGKPDPDDVRTMFDLLDAWAAAVAIRGDIKQTTRTAHRGTANRITGSGLPLSDVRVDRVDRRALEAYRDARIRAGAAPNTVRQDLIVIGQAWRWGRDLGLVPDRESPRCPVKVPRIERNVPTAEILASVLGVLDAEAPEWCSRAVRLLASTGARRSEIATLRWCDVDLDVNDQGHVRRGLLHLDGKTGPRRVPLHPVVAAELATWRPHDARPEDTVLGVSIETVKGALSRHVNVAIARLGLAGFRLHDIRSSVVGALYRSGTDPGVAGAIAGHSATTALSYYRRSTDDDMRAAVERAALGVLVVDNVLPLRRPG